MVVWRPMSSAAEYSRVAAWACGTSVLSRVDLPMPLWPSSRLVRPASRGARRSCTMAWSCALNSMTGTPSRRSGSRRARAASSPLGRSILLSTITGSMSALQAPARERPVRSSAKVGSTATTISNWSTLAANCLTRISSERNSRLRRGSTASMAPSSRPCGVMRTRSPTAGPFFLPRGKHCRNEPSASSTV
ncbi:Uncharacterised protein [Bordetella pertussis]|nr:Uncharacterised protein [Bordetella pertussis]